jgi:hypothetical protein
MNRKTKCGIFIYGVLFSHKREWGTDSCYNMDRLWKHAKLKKSHERPYGKMLWYHSIYMNCTKEAIL